MRTWTRIGIRLYAAVLASTALGVASRTVTYHDADTGDVGVYYAPVGVEYTAQGPLWSRLDVWACGEGTLPSWRCPADPVPVIRARGPVVVPVTGEGDLWWSCRYLGHGTCDYNMPSDF